VVAGLHHSVCPLHFLAVCSRWVIITTIVNTGYSSSRREGACDTAQQAISAQPRDFDVVGHLNQDQVRAL
jgi:hypothetical protein